MKLGSRVLVRCTIVHGPYDLRSALLLQSEGAVRPGQAGNDEAALRAADRALETAKKNKDRAGEARAQRSRALLLGKRNVREDRGAAWEAANAWKAAAAAYR